MNTVTEVNVHERLGLAVRSSRNQVLSLIELYTRRKICKLS
jgi:hypothetical protein